MLGKLLLAVVERSALPVTFTMVVVRRAAEDLLWETVGGKQPLVEDALALAPFFFGIACLDRLRKGQRGGGGTTLQPAWGAGIYPLCL
jgi:hypothetical protein